MSLRTVSLEPRSPGLSRTLVLLHGYGADERDLLPLAQELDDRLRVVSLQAPLSLDGMGRAWFHLIQDGRGLGFDPAEAREGMWAASAAVEQIARDSSSPLLLGFSQGAAIALGILLTKPELVGGVLALSGVPPMLDRSELTAPEALRTKRVFAAHGLHDPLLPIELGRRTRDELRKLGVDVTWREYPMGHMVVPEEVADAREWVRAVV